MMRVCLACDGTGCWRAEHHWGLGASHACAPCQACDSSGRVEERITARDAEADAETLRPFLFFGPRGGGEAAWYGTKAQNDIVTGVEQEAAVATGLAAHGAFRAVPGLRG